MSIDSNKDEGQCTLRSTLSPVSVTSSKFHEFVPDKNPLAFDFVGNISDSKFIRERHWFLRC
jgi:hypothetical protein